MKVAMYEGYHEGFEAPADGAFPAQGPRLQTRMGGTVATGNVLSKVNSAPAMVTRKFTIQSYLDDGGPGAVLPQPSAEPIVSSTRYSETVSGFGVALSPLSQTPVAIQFRFSGRGAGGSQVYLLKPGQTLFPYAQGDSFAGFDWGLPQGWLGGGVASLLVLQAPGAQVDWGSKLSPEILFHRQRLEIAAPDSVVALVQANWPNLFPWNGNKSASGFQQGTPAWAIEPTRTLLRFRMGAIADPIDLQAVVYNATDFDVGSNGETYEGNFSIVDFAVPMFDPKTSGSLGMLVMELPPLINRLATNYTTQSGSAGLAFQAVAAGPVVGTYVDVLRYGRL